MKTSASYHIKKALQFLPDKDEEIIKALKDIEAKVRQRESQLRRKDKQGEKCIYMFETSDRKVKIGVSENPLKRIRSLTTSNGYHIKRYYVTHPVAHPHKKENSLLKTFKNLNGEYTSHSFDEVVETFVKRFGDLVNRDFRLRYDFRYDEGPIFCSNGHKYKSYGTCSKSFHVKASEIHKAVTSGCKLKGYLFSKKIFDEYTHRFNVRTGRV